MSKIDLENAVVCDICDKEVNIESKIVYSDVSDNTQDKYHKDIKHLSKDIFHISYNTNKGINTHGHCCEECYDKHYQLLHINHLRYRSNK